MVFFLKKIFKIVYILCVTLFGFILFVELIRSKGFFFLGGEDIFTFFLFFVIKFMYVIVNFNGFRIF